MASPERTILFQVVTSSDARVDAFTQLLGRENVEKVPPHFTEDIIRKPVNSNVAEWPIEMAERKAMQDISALMVLSYVNGVVETGRIGDIQTSGKRMIRLYSDTINIAYDHDINDENTVVLEKPKNIASWLADREKGAMALSGKNTELCTGLTAIDMSDPTVHPATILIRTAVRVRPFTPTDVRAFIERHGEESVLKSASGVSFINETVELFDTDSPLRTYIQTDPSQPPTLLFELPTWGHLTLADRTRILYGAIPEAIDTLLTHFQPSYPATRGRTTTPPTTPPAS